MVNACPLGRATLRIAGACFWQGRAHVRVSLPPKTQIRKQAIECITSTAPRAWQVSKDTTPGQSQYGKCLPSWPRNASHRWRVVLARPNSCPSFSSTFPVRISLPIFPSDFLFHGHDRAHRPHARGRQHVTLSSYNRRLRRWPRLGVLRAESRLETLETHMRSNVSSKTVTILLATSVRMRGGRALETGGAAGGAAGGPRGGRAPCFAKTMLLYALAVDAADEQETIQIHNGFFMQHENDQVQHCSSEGGRALVPVSAI